MKPYLCKSLCLTCGFPLSALTMARIVTWLADHKAVCPKRP